MVKSKNSSTTARNSLKKLKERSSKDAKKPSKGKTKKRGAVSQFFVQILTAISIVSVLFLVASGCSMFVKPDTFGFIPFLGLMFPIFLFGTIVMLVVLLVFARRRCWIPLVGLVACSYFIRQYAPINFPSPAPRKSYKILSFNVESFNTAENTDADGNKTLKYIIRSGADIVCLQEALMMGNVWDEIHSSPFARSYPYCDTIRVNYEGSNYICLASKYPIVKKHRIFVSPTNGAGTFLVLLTPKDTLRVINCHFESNKLSVEERSSYSALVHEGSGATLDNYEKVSMYRKVTDAAKARASQVDLVADYINEHKGKSMVLCGDFNDTPISYAHHRLSSLLNDAYVATGNGISRSFNRDAIYVRIDNIMLSDDWKPFACRVDNAAGHISDHYPIVCNIKRKEKQ